MAFCSNCGAAVEGRFCAQCGSPVPSAATVTAPPPPPPAAVPLGLEENLASALCYLLGLLTGALFLVLDPYNKNRTIRFHAFQAIALHVGAIAVFIGIMIIVGVLHFVPFLGTFLAMILYPVASFAVLILWLMLMYKAYNKERWVLPIVGEWAERQV